MAGGPVTAIAPAVRRLGGRFRLSLSTRRFRPSPPLRDSILLLVEAIDAPQESVRVLPGPAKSELERGQGLARMMLVELGEFETKRGVIDVVDQRSEIGERARLVSPCF